MKAILFIAASLLFLCSCEANNDTECDNITQQYMQSLQYAKTPEARKELERQYHEKLNKSGC